MKPQFRYEKLGYVALNVTNLERSVAFYQNLMGLDLVAKGETHAYLRCSRDHHNLVLCQAEAPGIKRAAYKMASSADLDAAYQYFKTRDLNPTWIDEEERRVLQQGPTFRVREPNCGLTFEFYERMTFKANAYKPTVTKIERIGHVVIATKNYPQTIDALTGDFNFALSDLVEDKFSWMRCFPNPLHHSLGVGLSDRNHLHHVNFMVTDIDDIGAASNRLKAAGVPIVFGPGRHLPSTSIFLYFLDPDGMTMEFSFGMEEIPETAGRAPRLLELHPNTLDIWGSAPLEGFAKNGAIEAAHD